MKLCDFEINIGLESANVLACSVGVQAGKMLKIPAHCILVQEANRVSNR